jgi:hypothetical protein
MHFFTHSEVPPDRRYMKRFRLVSCLALRGEMSCKTATLGRPLKVLKNRKHECIVVLLEVMHST